MEEKDFPALYRASDKASTSAQQSYKRIIAVDLCMMIIAASLAIYNYQKNEPKLLAYVISATSLLTSLILTIVMKSKKYEDTWYQGRALAESCKTLTWRFVTCSESFESSVDLELAKTRFVDRLKELALEFKELNQYLDAKILSLSNITQRMIDIRSMNTETRKSIYLKYRIEEQRDWYANKAEYNKKGYNKWFTIIIFSQAIALLFSIYLIKNPESSVNIVGLFTTVSACALSWLQIKQHQELKQAYTTAAQELNFILEFSSKVDNEIRLSEFVLDSENAISREHTLWLAQKRR